MNFEKDSVHTHGGPRAGQRFDEFRLPSARLPFPAGQLHGMRHVENNRAARLAQNGK